MSRSLLAYGAVNLAQDAWNEQLVKRGMVDWKIPSALEPTPSRSGSSSSRSPRATRSRSGASGAS